MKIEKFQYNQGWTVKTFPPLDSENTLVLVFGASQFSENSAPITELFKAYPHSKMIGCSTAGEIFGSGVFDGTISVAVVLFEKTTLKCIRKEIKHSSESENCGRFIAKALDEEKLKGILLLSDGLMANGTELVTGLNSLNKPDVVITGGLAGDGSDFKKTWACCAGEMFNDSIVAVGFYGDHIEIGHGSKGGWDIFGPERMITKANKNILYELDGQPALKLYKNYLGEMASGLPATGLLYPLAIRKDSLSPQLVRTILAVDDEKRSLTFAGNMPEGYYAQLMRANFDRLVLGASQAADAALHAHQENDNATLMIAISCVGRKLVLGERIEEETEATLQSFPHVEQIGFYSYGEISPHTAGNCDLHNQTMTLTTIKET